MKNKGANIYYALGAIVTIFYFLAKRFLNIPDPIMGFVLGIGIAFYILGFIALRYDMNKLRSYKKNLMIRLIK